MLLLVGGSIYLLWRTRSLLMFTWAKAVGADQSIYLLRHFFTPVRPRLPAWSVYSLPEALWTSSAVLTFALIWAGSRSPLRFFWLGLVPAIGIGSEIGQALGVVPGRFDLNDVAASSIATLVSIPFALRIFKP
jgi:hypothetical protein